MGRKRLYIFLSILLVLSSVMVSMGATKSIYAVTADSEGYTWKNVQIVGGGYVDNIIFNSGEEDLIYARTDMGGAYRWNPDTGSWIPLTDWVNAEDWNNLGCESLAADPVDTNRVYIAAGTYTNDWTNANGCILRSEDKGETWELTELPFKNGANMLGRSMGERLAVDPNSNNVLYFGTRCGNGLWKSTDYGETWSKVTGLTAVGDYAPAEDDSTSYDNTLTGVVWVTPDTSSSTRGTPCKTIYVGVANKKGEDMVYVTKDGGATWAPVAGQPKNIVVPDPEKPTVTTGLFPHHGVLASNGVLYIPYSDGVGPYDGHKGEVWKYNTKTGVWTDITPVPTSSGDNYFGFGGLAVDAGNPDIVMVSTLNSWWPDANFYRSTDGGSTWTKFWDWNGYPSRIIRYTQDITASPWLTFGKYDNPPEPALKLGWMIGNISIDPFNSDRMMYGTGATVYGTTNLADIDRGGKVNLFVYAKGIEQTAVQDLVSPTTGDAHLISGMYDLGGFVHTDLDKVPSMMMLTPFLANTSIDYAELNPTKYVRVGNTDKGSSSRIGLSYSGGSSWYSLNNAWTSDNTDTTGGGTVAMSADGNGLVWAPGGQAVYYSTDSGSSWTLSKGVPAGAKVASDRVNSNKFYAYFQGVFYTSTDKGANFTASVSTGLPASGNIKAVAGVEGDIWLAGTDSDNESLGGLFHSTDSGKTFTKFDDVEKAACVGFGKAAAGSSYMTVFIAGKIKGIQGIFRSDDGGRNWIRINDDEHQYGTISCITGDPRIYGRVYIGTNGRGILYGDTTNTNPTVTPTTTPTVTPTVTPTATPTVTPTTTPTVTPTTTPTVTPTTTPTVTPTPPGESSLDVKFIGTTASQSNSIVVRYRLTNNGNTAVSLSEVKLRYYFTKEGTQSQNFYCDWSTAGAQYVSGQFAAIEPAKETADYYLEVGFSSGAGNLAAGQSIEVHSRFAKADWSNYTLTNDYSYKPSGTSYESWDKITAYLSGSLIYGVEP